MRRWLAVLAGMAAIALTGTALAMTGTVEVAEKAATETTIKEREAPPTTEKRAEPTTTVEERHEKDVVWEEPERSVPIEPRDHTPPEIEILHPENGQVFERKEVAFEGISEPGVKVSVGDRVTEASDEGTWRLVIVLRPGENEIEVVATDRSGNHASDTVTVVYRAPEEPKKEEPRKEEPKEEEPGEDKPKEEQPKEQEWEFSAHQTYGQCSENPPYDVFYGTGKPGSLIVIESAYGRATTEVRDNGEWELKVFFEGAPVGEVIEVHVVDKFEHHKVFEFKHTD